jgi:hypothetical protein
MQARLSPLSLSVPDALARYPCTNRDADWTLCLSNYRRQAVNYQRQMREVDLFSKSPPERG